MYIVSESITAFG